MFSVSCKICKLKSPHYKSSNSKHLPRTSLLPSKVLQSALDLYTFFMFVPAWHRFPISCIGCLHKPAYSSSSSSSMVQHPARMVLICETQKQCVHTKVEATGSALIFYSATLENAVFIFFGLPILLGTSLIVCLRFLSFYNI